MDWFQQILNLRSQASQLEKEFFMKEVLFSFQWWFLLVLTFLPWLIWWRIVDKKKLVRITVFGLFNLVIIILLDELGTTFRLWDYKYQVVPFFSISIAADLTYFTIAHIVIYQYFPKWKSFFFANVIYAITQAFILDPIAVRYEFYQPLNWEHFHSFPIYIAKAMIAKGLTEKVFLISERQPNK